MADHPDTKAYYASLRDSYLCSFDQPVVKDCATHPGCAKSRTNVYRRSDAGDPGRDGGDFCHLREVGHGKDPEAGIADKEKGEDHGVAVVHSRLGDNLGEERCTHMALVGLQNEAVAAGMTAEDLRDTGAVRYMKEPEDMHSEDTGWVDQDQEDSHLGNTDQGVQEEERGGDHKTHEQEAEDHTRHCMGDGRVAGLMREGEQVVVLVVLEGPEVHIDHTAAAEEGDLQSQGCTMEEEEGRPGGDRIDKAEAVDDRNGALVVYDEMKREEEEGGNA